MPVTLVDSHNLADFDSDGVPAANGFSIEFRDAGGMGRHLRFCDGSGAEIASFPWHDHVDAELRSLRAQVCSGTTARPFHDVEQGWEILIWVAGQTVIVLQGDFEVPGSFDTAFRVPLETFIRAWDNVEATTVCQSFTSMESALQNVDAARALLLGNRKLEHLPENIAMLYNLEHLNLYLNRLVTLPSTLGDLAHLKWIDLRFNKIAELPSEMSRLAELESINLAENQLTFIPEWVFALPRLKSFFVPGNPIQPSLLADAQRRRPDVVFSYAPPPGG